MSRHTLTSKVLLRHSDDFKDSRILFSGDIQSDLPTRFVCTENRVHTQFYHHWQILKRHMGARARFSVVAEQGDIADCDTLVYFWPKNKEEAKFQLMNLLSLLPVHSNIFIIGKNQSGVRGAVRILEPWILLNKIDSARRCSMYHGYLEKQPAFFIETFWSEYRYNGLIVKTLPGVFGRNNPDIGSQLLLSTLTSHIQGKVLEIGCGAGIISNVLASRSQKVHLTLCDVSASAVESSRATLVANRFEGSVFASNVFSNVIGRYDLIISNPPFHDGIEISFKTGNTLIRGAIHHLYKYGELRIVANAFLPYPKVLDEIFGNHEVIAQTNCFKVYRAIMIP